jgi:prepilin-type N-terminal cleavage/methylation domain-containing protein
MTRRLPRLHAGFTLVEALVVLTIVSLIVSLIAGITQIVQPMLRAAERSGLPEQRLLVTERWLATLLEGLVPDAERAHYAFRGTPDAVTGGTFAPLQAHSPHPERFRLSLVISPEGNTTLQYAEAAAPAIALARWSGTAEWRYIDETGREHAAWPPRIAASNDRPPALPARIELRARDAGAPRLALRPRTSNRGSNETRNPALL